MMEVIGVLLGVFRFWEDIKVFIAFRSKYNDEQWIQEGQILTREIKGAQTDEQRKALVRRLADHNASQR